VTAEPGIGADQVPAVAPASVRGRVARLYRRHRRLATLAGATAATAVLAAVLAGRGDEFTTALGGASALTLLVAISLQIVALSSAGVVGSLVNAQLGVAARIGALRRTAPADSPNVGPLIGAEFPIMAIEATLGALASITLVGPLGLPWWAPLVALAATLLVSAGLRTLALRSGRGVFRGLAVLRSHDRHALIVGMVLVAVFAQIARNWILLRAVGVDASPLDATALLIALIVLAQIPLGPTTGAAAAVLILGPHGVAAAAAAGVLLSATGTAGGLAFAGWAIVDRIWCHARRGMRDATAVAGAPPPRAASSGS
jgi:hypothetical protein